MKLESLCIIVTLIACCSVIPIIVHFRFSNIELYDQQKCRKVLWFMGVSGITREVNDKYFKFAEAAINSARKNAPSLVPFVLFNGDMELIPPSLRRMQDVTFVHHDISFSSHLVNSVCPYGAFYRLDLPSVMQKIQPTLDISLVDPDYVLYTDSDVLFFQGIDECSIDKPKVLHIGPDVDKTLQANSGILYVNVKEYQKHTASVIRLADRNYWDFKDCDQGLLLKYFRDGKLSTFLPAKYNWKGYWGGSLKDDDIAIAHFHALKPGGCIECLLSSNGESEECFLTHGRICHGGYQKLWKLTPDNGSFFRTMLSSYEEFTSVSTYA